MFKPSMGRGGNRKLLLLILCVVPCWASAQVALTPCQWLGRWRQCVTVPLAPPQRDAEAKQFRPPLPTRAKLYVVRAGTTEPRAKSSVLLGGTPVAELAPMTYAMLESAPGRQHIEIGPAPGAGLELDLEPGQTHYVSYRLGLLFNTVSGSIAVLDPSEGQALVLKSKLVEGVISANHESAD